ncbi:EF-P 5-aminopentanol modification-associated protein YfmH [Caloranaerobacter ferrireducens]|uniref:EF-P 5-aminopentanol modification-associated protein YfmH n=1 Tax=Caloranaerobacter ferrireducens TaxID=1323370 RepID=UPI00084D8F6E|nr:pitrilysin family protein [Caloranaerobacter ferrireducens]
MKTEVFTHDKLNEKLNFAKLDIGLSVFHIPKKGYIEKYAMFSTKYGSNDNKFVPVGESEVIEVPEGIAHFLEHKLFEEPTGNIFTKFSELGSYVNAFTNFNQTSYLFTCTDKFYENLEILVEFVQNPYFTDENVEKEKGIIEQEIRMYDDSPNWKVFFNCLKGMYHYHPVKVDIAGTVESIKKINKEFLYKCYNTFYSLENMLLVMVGDFDFEKALEVVENTLKNSKSKGDLNIKRFYPEEPKNIKESILEESLQVSSPLFNIGFKDIDLGYDGDMLLKKEIETNILLDLLFGRSSELYQKLYENGLINNTFGSQYVGYKDYGHSIIGGESVKPKEVLEIILKHLEKIKINGLNENDYTRIRKKFLGYHIMDFDSIEFIANSFTSYYFKNTSLFKYMDILASISLEDLQKRLDKHFREDNFVISIVNP